MRMYDIIEKKRDGGKLNCEEIEFFVSGFVSKEIPDYQASALLMAAFIRGLDKEETLSLTNAMMLSGETADLSDLKPVADKHSTGGVADTTTFLVVPLLASCGLRVGKMSGRGLGHTGGTLDKLEAIPGMNVSLTLDGFKSQIKSIGAAIMGQTLSLCPADKLIYALRDVTATVESIPLIASSIMSKKLASGADIIMLDVKTGSGAFMENLKDSKKLAETMVSIGNGAGRKTAAIISDMSQPLGNAVGNSLEVIEAIEILQGKIKGDLLTVALELSSNMLCLSGLAENSSEAMDMLKCALESKRSLNKFGEIIKAQGGNPDVINDTSLLPKAKYIENVSAQKSGFLSKVNCKELGIAAGELGAGRLKIDDTIDLSVGFIMKKRIGDAVTAGEVICEVHSNDKNKLNTAIKNISDAVFISNKAEKPVLIYDRFI